MKQIKVRGLAKVGTKDMGTDLRSVALTLTDTEGRTDYFGMGPEGLNVLVDTLLPLVAAWADEPDLKVDTLTGRKRALRATRIELDPGPTTHEVGVRVCIGPIELAFVLPAMEFIDLMRRAAQQIEIKKADPSKPN